MNYNKAEFQASYGLSSQLPQTEHLEFVFAGRSNVGKSSLINKLFNRKNLARVSAVPGKTATINFYRVEDICFVDLPGYGFAKVAKREKHRWSELIEGYFQADRNVGLVLLLVDMRHPPTALDLDMMDYLMATEYPFVIVLTKSDKLSRQQQEERLRNLQQELPCENVTILPVSSQTGEGIDALKSILEEIVTGTQNE